MGQTRACSKTILEQSATFVYLDLSRLLARRQMKFVEFAMLSRGSLGVAQNRMVSASSLALRSGLYSNTDIFKTNDTAL